MPKQRNRQSSLADLLGKRVKARRLELHLTQGKLAETVGVDSETISRIERGTVLPSLLRLEQIAVALRTGVTSLLAKASAAPDDQAAYMLQMLKGLDEPDRHFVLDFIKRFAEYRKTKSKRQ